MLVIIVAVFVYIWRDSTYAALLGNGGSNNLRGIGKKQYKSDAFYICHYKYYHHYYH